MTFEQWIAELDRIAIADGCVFEDSKSYSQATAGAPWVEVFESGMTPAEAWNEEKAAAF